jgi:hypothetical protein
MNELFEYFALREQLQSGSSTRLDIAAFEFFESEFDKLRPTVNCGPGPAT